MRSSIKIVGLTVLFGTAACGAVDETAPEGPARAEIVEPVGPPAGVTTDDSCEQAGRWIDQNRDELPSTYDQIIRFPDQYRSAIFGALRPEMRSALFKTQIARFRLRPSLTEEQRAVLDRADALMSPAFYAQHGSPDLATVETLHDLERQSRAAFGFEEARALLAHLGPPEETMVAPPVRALDQPLCECSTVSDWCGLTGRTCRSIPCTAVSFCGSGLVYRCNGVCGRGF